ncbi:VOC family protein [Streptomyces sp. 067-1]|uniref:VOC family protein n=1 Tax=Streptomyces sp. 067-1 TaxID=2789269 RepID=UPI0039F5C63E
MTRPTHGTLHHVEIWVPDLSRALASLGWLLATLGYTVSQSWASGRSWLLGPTYLVLEQSPSLTADRHDRRRPGLNHLAFHEATVRQRLAVRETGSQLGVHIERSLRMGRRLADEAPVGTVRVPTDGRTVPDVAAQVVRLAAW